MTRTREENAADLAYEDERRSSLVPVYVVVEGEASEPADECVHGVYLCHVDPSLTAEQKAEVALDHFHENNGIDCLDDFEITVFDADGAEMPGMESYENGSLRSYGEYGDRLNDDAVPAAVMAKLAAGGDAPVV